MFAKKAKSEFTIRIGLNLGFDSQNRGRSWRAARDADYQFESKSTLLVAVLESLVDAMMGKCASIGWRQTLVQGAAEDFEMAPSKKMLQASRRR